VQENSYSKQDATLSDTLKEFFRLKKPCANCPFRKEGAIDLRPGRLDGIKADLLATDKASFPCHKTLNRSDLNDEGEYQYQGSEAMCAGAAAYLLKKQRASISMRMAFAMGIAKPEDWEKAKELTVD
jgi:hypothetical protein